MEHQLIIKTIDGDLVVRRMLNPHCLFDRADGIKAEIQKAMQFNEKAITERKQDDCDHYYVELLEFKPQPRSKRCIKCRKIVEIGDNDCDFEPIGQKL